MYQIMNIPALDFELPNHHRLPTPLETLIHGHGLLLAFVGDIWKPTNVRRVMWLQRHLNKFNTLNLSLALVAVDQPHTLYGFQMSNPLPTMFPLLADADGSVHKAYAFDRHPGVMLIDPTLTIRAKWLLSDAIWFNLNDVGHALAQIPEVM
jgi:peroxiredoxin